MTASALNIEDLTMKFDGTPVLKGVSLEVASGEIHALLGLNGSGKSTLVKCLTGVHDPSAGSIFAFGHELNLPVRDPAAHGIATVHQDAGFAAQLTVLENLGASTQYGSQILAPVRERSEEQKYLQLFEQLGLKISLHAKVSDLNAADIAMLAVVRALHVLESSDSGQLFILDEPTATLGRAEAEVVLDLMRRIASNGAGVVFIGHRLNEVFAVSDRATILRDGAVAHSGSIRDLTHETVVQHMLGERMSGFFPDPPEIESNTPIFRVRELSGGQVHNFSLDIRPGEIIGVTGLLGMGQEAIPALLTGDKQPQSGSIVLNDQPQRFRHPADSISAGIARIPADRVRDGSWLDGTAQENLTLPILNRFFSHGWLKKAIESRYSLDALRGVRLHPLIPELPMTAFSGGNQQKIMFAKWDQIDPRVFILHEPTQGVDPAAGREILDRIVDRAAAGAAVMIVSGDHEQLVEMCHRVVVMVDGKVSTVLPRRELNEESLLLACSV